MQRIDAGKLNLKEKVIYINRVSKVVKGGKRFSFSALVAVGDENGHVGIGKGTAGEVPDAIRKGIEAGRKNIIKVELRNTTIPFEITSKFGAAKVFMKPASMGTGVIAGGPARVILELAGVKDILTKSIGRTSNAFNVAYATMKCLKEISEIINMGGLRKKQVNDERKDDDTLQS